MNRLQVDALSLSLTTDIWTSSSTEAFLSLTCHFLTSEWEFVDCLLATKCFPEHHIGENISAIIKEVLTSYEIPDSGVSSMVHDQGSNMSRPLNSHGLTVRHMVLGLFSRSHGQVLLSHCQS